MDNYETEVHIIYVDILHDLTIFQILLDILTVTMKNTYLLPNIECTPQSAWKGVTS